MLGKFSNEEMRELAEILDYAKSAVLELINSDIDAVSQKFTRKKAAL